MRRPSAVAILLVSVSCRAGPQADNPFDPARLMTGTSPFPAAAALSLYPPDQWRLVGTLQRRGRWIGLIEDPGKRVHLLAPGLTIDNGGLQVVRVEAHALLLRDTRPDRHDRLIQLRLESP